MDPDKKGELRIGTNLIVTSVDYVSTMTEVGPFLVGLTAE
jgi:hypothetical protein